MTFQRLFICGLFLILVSLTGQAEERRLFILHTNDIHGHLEPEADRGFTRLATLVRAYQAAFPGQVLLLDAGDTSLGTPTSGLFFGIPTARCMKALGYDAIALGNHEFNWGKEKQKALIEQMNTNVLCANLVEEADSTRVYPGWTVVERNGLRVGIIGLVTPDTPRRAPRAATEGWRFLPPADAARLALQEMPPVDAVLALTHLGVPQDKELVKDVPGLDMVVGGHSHTALMEAEMEGTVPIVQTGSYARYLGMSEITVETETGELSLVSYRLIKIHQGIPEEPEIAQIVAEYSAQVKPILAEVVAQVSEVIPKTSAGNYDTPLGNLIADAIRETSGADVALYNRGGVRTDMAAGPLSVGDIHKLFPFNDPIVLIQVSGKDLEAILLQGTCAGEGPLSPSGLTASVDAENQRLIEVEVQGEPLDPDRTYNLAITLFLSGGGDGMTEFSKHEIQAQLDYPRELLRRYLKSHPEIGPQPADRLKLLRR